jgi:HK97 family phage portal protein
MMRSPLSVLVQTFRNDSPVPLASYRTDTISVPIFGGNDDERYMSAYGAVGTLFAIVNRITNSTAQVQWHLWRKAKSGLDEDRVEVTRHAALDAWQKPNPFMPRQEFVETFQQHIELAGMSCWIVGRSPLSTIPLELWPCRPDRVFSVPHPTKFISGYVYMGPDGQKIPLDLNEVIQLRMPNPLDLYSGLGPVQSILTDLDATKYAAEWNKSFFLNSAEPGGIIEVDRSLNDLEFEKMRTRWAEQHRGVSKAHRVAIMETGKWVDRKYTMRDMQFSELRNVSREVIREAFGFPKPLLGAVDDVNRANAEAADVMFGRHLIVPRCERIKGALNNDFLPLFGKTTVDVEFDYDTPVPEDREADRADMSAQALAVKALIEAGFDAAEAAEVVGLPEMAWKERVTVVAAPPGQSKPGADNDDPPTDAWADFDNAMKWEAVEEDDDSVCDPCAKQRGKLYRNREDAYKDYPTGRGFKDCVGAQHGNDCRGYVRKRKSKKNESEEDN